MEFNWTEVILAIIAILSAVVTHLLDRKKFNSEIHKIQAETNGETIDNMDKSLEFYEKWVSNTNKRLDEVLDNQSKLMKENLSLRTELTDVKAQTTRMSSLLCTNLPCENRVQDSSVLECVYYNKHKINNKTKSKKNIKKVIKDVQMD